MDFLGFSWKYIGEGNAHIVLEVVNSNFVLRITKENDKTTDLCTIQKSVDFVNKVMTPLLFHHSVEPYEIVKLKIHEVIKLREQLQAFRPEHRKIKSVLSNIAIKAPNLSIVSSKFNTNYCLEIKPKEGFMSNSLRRYSKCYYCMKQFLKLHENKIDSVSKYCPLDLFSGDKMLMKKALLNLIDNPQNNLKLFKNGMLVYHEKSLRSAFDSIMKEIAIFQGNINLFLDSIIAIFLCGSERLTCVPETSDNFTDTSAADLCTENIKLSPNNFLHKLLEIQKLSETPVDSEEILMESTDYVSSFIEIIDAERLILTDEKHRQRLYSVCNPQYLALIGSVVKDCSIMISFSEYLEDGVPTIQIGDQKLSYKLAVTDLEPKSAKTLLKRKETEKKLVEIYEKYAGNTKNHE
ncbi:inositol-pentakisphosphate 2-kinase-like isoform X1 [Plodia interpunctella]|uniref:inositol-pentakisphosphate 2-kinase-like isoform X1 n=1 Tax=Plodia interpunctella TaxID=58824 RepID=UPI0023678AA2|nr:inositol-pentakisphosphate 2-kinase-like isoform X1 [Plodia interpunctella]